MADDNTTDSEEEKYYASRPPRTDHEGRFWVVLAHVHMPDQDDVNTSQFLGLFHDEDAAYEYMKHLVRMYPPDTEEWNEFQGWPSAEAFLEANPPRLIEDFYRSGIGYKYNSKSTCVEYVWVEEKLAHDGYFWDIWETESASRTKRLLAGIEVNEGEDGDNPDGSSGTD